MIKRLRNKFSSTRQVKGGLLIAFALIGVIVLSQTHAATQSVSTEPEEGLFAGCIQERDDASASGGSYVEFASSASCSQDNSGNTIPDTNYAIPAGAIFMSPSGSDKNSSSVDGNDANDGKSEAQPVRTINNALAKVANGGTVVMRGGEYRDWNFGSNQQVTFQGKSFTIQAYPHEAPWFNGSDVVSDGWTSDGSGLWQRTWDTPNFCGGQYYTAVSGLPPFSPNLPDRMNTACVYQDSVKGNSNVAGDPQMVFINDKKLSQVPNKSQVNNNTFYYDWANKKIYISTNPAGNKVELAKRPQAFMLNKGNYGIKGVGFKRYGSGAFPEGNYWYSANVVLVNEPQSIVVENSVFSNNAGNTLIFSYPTGNNRVTKSVFANNGGVGLAANGNARTVGVRNDIVIDSSIFNANNQENFDLNCVAACGTAANAKLTNMTGFVVKNNVFENTVGRAPGFWCDMNCTDGVIVNNLVRNNGDRGIFYEISSKGIIASNLVINNGTVGITVLSATTKVYNNTVVVDSDNYPASQAYAVADDSRWSNGSSAATGIGPDTRGIEFVNNLGVSLSDGLLMITEQSSIPNVGTNTTIDQFYDILDYNAYFRRATNKHQYMWGAGNYIKSSTAFTNMTGLDSHALDLTGNPATDLFVDMAKDDYRVRSSSPAYANGIALPSDVANALGLPNGSQYSRGAITWPGKK